MIFETVRNENDLRITFSGVIGDSFFESGLSYQMIRDAIEPVRRSLRSVTLEICSPGGDVLEAFAIYNYLYSLGLDVTAEVTGWAASAASYIIMAADQIKVHANSFVLIHEPSVCDFGDRHDHRKAAAVLDAIYESLVDAYMTHATAPRSEIETLVTAETWLTAEDAVRLGLADEILDAIPAAAAAQFPLSEKFTNIPTSMKGIYPMAKKTKKILNEDPVKPDPVDQDNSESGGEPAPAPAPDPADAEESSSGGAPENNESISDLADQISALMSEVKDLRGALQAAKESEADAKKQLADLRNQIDRLTAGVKHSAKKADPVEDAKDWETLMAEGDGSPAHYIAMRKQHPEAFKAYLAKFQS